jgi:hypothetical protein
VVVQVFVAVRNLLGNLRHVAAATASGGDKTSEVLSSILHGENLWSDLNWLCLAMTLLKRVRAKTFSRVKTYDHR